MQRNHTFAHDLRSVESERQIVFADIDRVYGEQMFLFTFFFFFFFIRFALFVVFGLSTVTVSVIFCISFWICDANFFCFAHFSGLVIAFYGYSIWRHDLFTFRSRIKQQINKRDELFTGPKIERCFCCWFVEMVKWSSSHDCILASVRARTSFYFTSEMIPMLNEKGKNEKNKMLNRLIRLGNDGIDSTWLW